MNFMKIRKKFTGCSVGLFFLFSAGFAESYDGSRLEFRLGNWDMLKRCHALLEKKKANPDVELSSKRPTALSGATAASAVASAKSKDAAAAKSSAAPKKPMASVASASATSEESSEKTDGSEDAPVEDGDGDSAMTDASGDADDADAAPPVSEEETAAAEADAVEVRGALADLDADDRELFEQMRSHKDTTVMLSMSELVGLTKEEKVALLDMKRNQYRKEKAAAKSKHTIDRERSRREGVKHAMEAQRKREEYQRKMMADRKKRDKKADAERKKRVRDKIKTEQAARKKERALAQKRRDEARSATEPAEDKPALPPP
jgi:hypothetical protein